MSAEPRFKETPFVPEAPQPLVREIAPGAAYPVQALGPLRPVVQAVQGTTQAPGGDLAHITGYASKAAEQAARIAGVLTLWRDLDARQVQPGDMGDAIALAQFYLAEASRLASAATV